MSVSFPGRYRAGQPLHVNHCLQAYRLCEGDVQSMEQQTKPYNTPVARCLSTRLVCSLAKTYVGKAVHALTGISLPVSELLNEVDASHSAFGLKKLAILTTKAGKLYALDMADGSIAWCVQSFMVLCYYSNYIQDTYSDKKEKSWSKLAFLLRSTLTSVITAPPISYFIVNLSLPFLLLIFLLSLGVL